MPFTQKHILVFAEEYSSILLF